MRTKAWITLVIAVLLLAGSNGFAAETNTIADELKNLVTQIQTKLKEGKTSEQDLSAELKRFDDILAEHKNEKTDAVAQVLMMKALLYLQVFDNPEKAAELVRQLKRDFPQTKAGQRADQILESIDKQAAAEKIKAGLKEGTKFPDFNEKDLNGNPLSIANNKGKVVLIDFWATWCGPCRAELPNVIKTYEKYHGQGFEIIGVSLDDDRAKLETFIKQNKMTWPQYFDGQGWGNKLAAAYGVNSIPATYLLDGNGKILGKDLRGEVLETAVGKALEKNK